MTPDPTRSLVDPGTPASDPGLDAGLAAAFGSDPAPGVSSRPPPTRDGTATNDPPGPPSPDVPRRAEARYALLGEIAIGEQVHRMAVRADVVIDLVAALQLGLVERAERASDAPIEAPVDVLQLGLAGGGRGRQGERRQGEPDARCDDGSFAQHRAQPFFSALRTGAEIESGTGRVFSENPRKNRIA